MQTLEYKVVFKEGPHEPQQTASFNGAAAAYAKAVQIETDGGVAVVVRAVKGEPLDSTNPITLRDF